MQNNQQAQQQDKLVDFNFLEAEMLAEKYQKLLKNNPFDLNTLITLGFIEIKYYQRIQKAESLFQKALEINKDDVDAYLGLCECMMLVYTVRNKQKIQDFLDKCFELKNDYWRVYYYKSVFLFKQNEDQQALDILQNAEKQNINEALFINHRAQLKFFINHDAEQALLEIEKSIKMDKLNDPNFKLRKAYILKYQRQFDKSIQIYQEILSTCPWNFTSLINLLYIYKQMQNEDKLIEIKETLTKYFSENSRVYEYIGDSEDDDEKKLWYFNKSLELNPQNPSYMLSVSNIYIKQKKYLQSVRLCLKIIKIDKYNADAYYNLGHIYDIHYNNFKLSIIYFEHALNINFNIQTLKNLGRVYSLNNQNKRALEYYQKCQQVDPENQGNYQEQINIERIIVNINNDSGLKLCKECVLQNPKKSQYYILLEQIYQNNKKYALEVQQFLHNTSKLYPKNTYLLFCLGKLEQFEFQNYQIACEFYNNVLNFDPNFVFREVVHYNLGKAYFELNEIEKCKNYFYKSIELGLSNKQDAFQYLRILYIRELNYDKWIELNQIEQKHFPEVLKQRRTLEEELIYEGERKKLIQLYNKMLEVNSDQYELYKKIGKIYENNLYDYEKALENYILYTKKSEYDMNIYNKMGLIEMSQFKNYDQALKYFNQAIIAYNRSVTEVKCNDVRYNLGLCCYKMKDDRNALINFRKCLLVCSDYEKNDIYKYIFKIERKQKNYKQSLKALKKMYKYDDADYNEDYYLKLLKKIKASGYQDQELKDFRKYLKQQEQFYPEES